MTCATVGELLLDYLEGELAPAQAREVEAHLKQCASCAARCRQTRALLGELSAARQADDSPARQDAQPPVQSFTLAPQAVLGDFEILGELGRGGMGVVYRARQLSLNRIVALKVLAPGLIRSQRSVMRFAREAQAAARLHHTNIVPIYAQGCEQGHFYYAMELIEGESLDRILRRQKAVGRRPPPDYKRLARLVAGVAEGLHHAHEQGVIHRDIKPHNLLLGPDDELHITDFGLARLLDEPGLTLSTELVGTPAYMAPEQLTAGGSVDRRTDVYALGVTLYEMLTLERPFGGEAYEQTIAQILRRDPAPPRRLDPHVPVDLETICLRALEKDPRRRFQTAAALARDLRRYATDFPIVSRRVGALGRAARWVRRRPAHAAALAAAALVVILVPLLLGTVRLAGQAQIQRAFDILLNDYRDSDRALAELGWASRLGGDGYRRQFVKAFACVRTEPERAVGILQRLLAERPDDPDAHYLLAWAYARCVPAQGTERWADAERQIALGDALEVEPSAAGWFFRGQALWGLDPREAQRTFDRAIDARDNFTQAMLHQGRAMNQIMYSLRDLSYYEKAVTRLEFVVRSQSGKAYPRYLLALTHLLAAEIYQAQGDAAAAQQAYAASLGLAREAQQVEPDSPRGYAAEAGYHESRGDYREAIAAWQQFDRPDLHASASDRAERYAYQMRLHFWLGEYAEAQRMWAGRYGPRSDYDPVRGYDADETLYAVLIAASAGHWQRVETALAAGLERARGHPEYLLRLHAAYRLLGRPAPPELLAGPLPTHCKLSPGWSAEWLEALRRYARGELDWQALREAAGRNLRQKDDLRLRLAGAFFFRGVGQLAAGQRPQALAAFENACEQHDNENHCFRARFLLNRLKRDPGWPAWLPATTPDQP